MFMNLLVVGGLFLFGVVALVAVVFVIRSEPATKEGISVPPPVPTEQGEPETPAVADDPSSSGETLDTPQGETTLVAENQALNEWQSLANGQLYELKNELRGLHDQAQELAYRLKTMVDMVERVEQAQNGRFPVEGQPSDTVNTSITH
jgi:hypothetical protein